MIQLESTKIEITHTKYTQISKVISSPIRHQIVDKVVMPTCNTSFVGIIGSGDGVRFAQFFRKQIKNL